MLLDLIESRKSIRKYQDKNIPDEILNKILKAGYLAPSWMNSQPWKFILVKNQQTKDLLSELSGYQPHVKTADALIVCIADNNAWDEENFGKVLKARGMTQEGIEKVFRVPMYYPKLLGEERVLLRSVEQVTYAVSYMMLTAYDLGVGSCIIGAFSNKATVVKPEIMEKVNKALNVKDGEVIITIITLGYALEEEKALKTEKQRKDYNSVVFFEKLD